MNKKKLIGLILFASLSITPVAYTEEQVMIWSYSTASGVWTVGMSSDGKYIVAGSYDNHIYFFDSTGKLLWKYATGDTVWTVAISSDGKYTAAGSYDNNVYLFDSTGKLLWKYKTDDVVLSTSISSDGKYTAAGSYDNHIYLFDSDGVLHWKYKVFDVGLSTSISSDGKYIAAGSYDSHIYFFDSTGKLLWKYKASDEIWDVALSSGGEYVVAGSRDNNVYFLNYSGNLSGKYRTAYYVSSVATSIDGNYTVAGSYDNNIYFFKRIQPADDVSKLPRLSVSKFIVNSVIAEGESTTVEIAIQNLGEGRASNVRFRDSIPGGLELIEGKLAWGGGLKPGESIVISYKVRAKNLYKPESATYQLPRLDVIYEDLRGAIYHVESIAPSLIVTPETAKVKSAPTEVRWEERILRKFHTSYVIVFMFIALILRMIYVSRVYREKKIRALRQIKHGVMLAEGRIE